MNWGLLIVGGFGLALLAQAIGCIVAFRYSPKEGVLSLLVPGYLFLALRRSGAYWRIVGLWLLGVAAVVTGTIVLS